MVNQSKNSFTVEFLHRIEPTLTVFSSTNQPLNDPDNLFSLCFEQRISQYYYSGLNTGYPGGLRAIKKVFEEQFTYQSNQTNQTGYIRLRFIVNCQGEIGRFSMLEVDEDYQVFSFDPALVNSLLTITRNHLGEGWLRASIPGDNSIGLDYYKHLTFKIKEGQLIDILP